MDFNYRFPQLVSLPEFWTINSREIRVKVGWVYHLFTLRNRSLAGERTRSEDVFPIKNIGIFQPGVC